MLTGHSMAKVVILDILGIYLHIHQILTENHTGLSQLLYQAVETEK